MDISRTVANPAPGHYPTLEEAKRAASKNTRFIVFRPDTGYVPATYERKAYTMISRYWNGRWTPRTDSLPRTVRANDR